MKNIVISDEYRETDLKPPDLLKQYLEMTQADCLHFFIEKGGLVDYPSPGSRNDRSIPVFKKFGLQYKECQDSNMLFVSPRPTDEALHEFYARSSSSVFWREKLSRFSNEKRKEKIIYPRVNWIVDSTQEYFPKASHWLDISVSQYAYIEEMMQTECFQKKTAVNPFLQNQKGGKDRSIHIINKPWWEVDCTRDLRGKADIISIFEVVDRVSNVGKFFEKIQTFLNPGGLVFMTAILSTGFDIQILWEKAGSVFPPDRLNVFSFEAIEHLAKFFSFECLELSTPGILDVDIVEKTLKENKEINAPRFVGTLLEKKGQDVKGAFQKFLQANQLSSYGRVVLRKN